MPLRLLVGAFLVVALAAADAPLVPHFHGRFYAKGSSRKTLLFTNEGFVAREGNTRRHQIIYRDLQGAPAVTEDAVYVDDRLKSFKVQQHQLNATGSVEVVGKKVRLSWTQDGKTKTSEEEVGDDLLPGPGIYEYMRAHWAELLRGDALKVSYPELQRGGAFGFKLYKDRELTVDGHDCVALVMKPTNIFVAMVVNPTTFILTKDGENMVSIEGHSSPKVKVKDEWQDCETDAVFTR